MLQVVTSLVLAIGGAMFIVFVVLLLVVYVFQKQQINNLDSKISTAKVQLGKNTNLNKILTVQNQLESLPSLEAQDPVTSRLFNYLSEITPVNADISDFSIDYTNDTMVITGSADSLTTVNKYVDTLKFTTYAISNKNTKNNAFSQVVLSSFGVSPHPTNNRPASFTINCNFNPIIFNVADAASLVVPPNFITTRSITQQPQPFKLFVAAPKGNNNG